MSGDSALRGKGSDYFKLYADPTSWEQTDAILELKKVEAQIFNVASSTFISKNFSLF